MARTGHFLVSPTQDISTVCRCSVEDVEIRKRPLGLLSTSWMLRFSSHCRHWSMEVDRRVAAASYKSHRGTDKLLQPWHQIIRDVISILKTQQFCLFLHSLTFLLSRVSDVNCTHFDTFRLSISKSTDQKASRRIRHPGVTSRSYGVHVYFSNVNSVVCCCFSYWVRACRRSQKCGGTLGSRPLGMGRDWPHRNALLRNVC